MGRIENPNITTFQINVKNGEKCEICEKVFKTKVKLKVHYRNTHENMEERYKCNICSRYFLRNSTLQLHLKTIHERKKRLQM